MKLEDQVTSLELAKHLKELGIEQESMFYWVSTEAVREFHLIASLWHMWGIAYDDDDTPRVLEDYSAFTVAELGELLPKEITYQEKTLWLETGYDPELEYWWIGYLEIPVSGTRVYPMWEQDTSEADARAKMLIHITLSSRIPVSLSPCSLLSASCASIRSMKGWRSISWLALWCLQKRCSVRFVHEI